MNCYKILKINKKFEKKLEKKISDVLESKTDYENKHLTEEMNDMNKISEKIKELFKNVLLLISKINKIKTKNKKYFKKLKTLNNQQLNIINELNIKRKFLETNIIKSEKIKNLINNIKMVHSKNVSIEEIKLVLLNNKLNNINENEINWLKIMNKFNISKEDIFSCFF